MGTYFDVTYMIKNIPVLLSYVHITLTITIVSAIIGILLGCVIALIRINNIKFLKQLVVVFTYFIRGTPLLVQIFLVYFGFPEILNKLGFNPNGVSPLIYIIIVFTLYVAAYSGEVMRSAILAIPQGQLEAAYAIGMTSYKAYIRIVLPQAFASAIPSIINTIISELKGTALVFNVGIVDMMNKAELIGGYTQRYLELYVDAAIIYAVMIVILSYAGNRLEKYSRRYQRA